MVKLFAVLLSALLAICPIASADEDAVNALNERASALDT